MGWMFQETLDQKVNRKRECDSLINTKDYDLLKSRMVGSVWYGALRNKKTGFVSALVMLTKIRSKDVCNFGTKAMTEDMGPNEAKCPMDILDLLSPTDSPTSLEWRDRCRQNAAKPKLSDLPIGTHILIQSGGKTTELIKTAPAFQFKRPWWYIAGEGMYMPHTRIPNDFQIK